MLAYVFWHRPVAGVAPEAYTALLERFQRSLAARPPAGFVSSACFAAPAPNWLGEEPAFEDWYVVEDYAALGVLNEAAVGRAHISAHDAAAARCRRGHRRDLPSARGQPRRWRTRARCLDRQTARVEAPLLAALLGDGMEGARAGLWQRQLALGPAPEYCLLAVEGVASAGVARDAARAGLERDDHRVAASI